MSFKVGDYMIDLEPISVDVLVPRFFLSVASSLKTSKQFSIAALFSGLLHGLPELMMHYVPAIAYLSIGCNLN